MSRARPQGEGRDALSTTHRAGNVSPLTTRDRHTGDGERALHLGDEAAAAACGDHLAQPEAPASIAGSRDEKWRSPLEGSGEGCVVASADAARDNATAEHGPPADILGSYSVNNCQSRRGGRSAKRGPDSFERAAWQRVIESSTRPHRLRQALRHEAEARSAKAEGEPTKALWHERRARGQVRRFDQVRDCGSTELLVRCEACGHEVKRMEIRCGVHRLCVTCRGARAELCRARFRAGRARAIARADRLLHGWQRGGRWSEKFVTFTLPHSGDVARDLKTLPQAWRIFRGRLFEHLRKDRHVPDDDMALVAFVRVIEVTPGRAHDGHAHLHVYILAPFLLKVLLRHLWGETLTRFGYEVPTEPIDEVYAGLAGLELQQATAWLRTRRGANGRALEAVYAPIIDLEEAYGDVERELVKYLIKDAELLDGTMFLVDPELFARIYEGLEGVRTIVTSRGFFPNRHGTCACEKCGSQNVSRERAKPKAEGTGQSGDHA